MKRFVELAMDVWLNCKIKGCTYKKEKKFITVDSAFLVLKFLINKILLWSNYILCNSNIIKKKQKNKTKEKQWTLNILL